MCASIYLQCRWVDGNAEVVIRLPPDEASDLMNFVFKDDATNTWYDNNGSNFRVPLRADADGSSPRQPDVIPKQLCDKWAWMRWDHYGRPPRSEDDAASDYDRGVQVRRLHTQPAPFISQGAGLFLCTRVWYDPYSHAASIKPRLRGCRDALSRRRCVR